MKVMSNKPIQVPVSWDGLLRKADRSVSMRFTSVFEVTNDDFAEMDRNFQQQGYLLFKGNAFTDDDIPDNDAPSDTKSPSVRLRSILYVYHMQKDGDPAKFREFYETTMEKYITKVKESME